MKKAVIVFGSPRTNSNTALLVKEAERGLNEAGISTETFFLNKMKIKGCQACYVCKNHDSDECALHDDMQEIHSAIKEAQGLIVATPIYFGYVTSQTKTWLDRMFPFIDMNLNPKLPGKKAGFIITQNQPNAELFRGNIENFMMMVSLFGFALRGNVLACDVDQDLKPLVTGRPELMQQAYALGRGLMD